MTWFAFNENSILNNSFSRWINFIVIIIVFIIPLAMTEDVYRLASNINNFFFLFAMLFPSAIVKFCLEMVIDNTHFYEWDYKERKKKKEFILNYTWICTALSVAFSFSLFVFIGMIADHKEIKLFEILVYIMPVLVTAFNIINIPSLYYPEFEDYLEHSDWVDEKPDWWVDK